MEERWEKAVLAEVGCELYAPGALTKKVDTLETAIGAIAYHTYFYQSAGTGPENYFYMLSYCAYPPRAVHSDSTALLEDFFQATVESAVASVDGDLIYMNEISLDDYPGRFWRIDYLDEQAIIRTRAYLVENRYYAIQTITHRDRSLNTASDRFLDSFRLLE